MGEMRRSRHASGIDIADSGRRQIGQGGFDHLRIVSKYLFRQFPNRPAGGAFGQVGRKDGREQMGYVGHRGGIIAEKREKGRFSGKEFCRVSDQSGGYFSRYHGQMPPVVLTVSMNTEASSTRGRTTRFRCANLYCFYGDEKALTITPAPHPMYTFVIECSRQRAKVEAITALCRLAIAPVIVESSPRYSARVRAEANPVRPCASVPRAE